MNGNESLEQMVTNYNPEQNGNEEQESENDSLNENVDENENQAPEIEITNLSTWFRENVQNFNNIFRVDARLRGVDSNKNLIMTVKDQNDPTGETRFPYVFRDADRTPVLNLPGSEMFIYQNNTFQINYDFSDQVFVKTYNLRTGIGIVFCLRESQNNHPVPVYIDRYKKVKTESIPVPDITNIPIEERLNETVDIETVIIKYKQIQKFKDDINTNRDLLNFFIERQSKIQDINHLIQIDSILASVFN